jgi:hypothetical protein
MKTKIILTALLLSILLFSCKNESKTNEVGQIKKNVFKFNLDLLIKKNDTIHLYYTEDNTINFTEENSMWVSILGKNDAQQMTFELPEDFFPTQFRIDFGVNGENEKIKLNSVKFDYLDKSNLISESLIYNCFRINADNTTIDSVTKELSRKDPKAIVGPSLYPQEAILKTELDKFSTK